ncbi:hypothetical protein [Pelagicoccus sp. SDUM812003]|uniref:hypothetical protein n=1 Tax=Pelagicoccus sp. SDUM812003 TaxID=3041267 RepID=UPI0028105A21|nr:hypothetical protein [Pelagicoccus sp. SDUM812003]MDQ8203008.1 hypothetical protein [Pelagicoccus sp. SDUM812003]
MTPLFRLASFSFLAAAAACAANGPKLERYAEISEKAINESSGIVKSRLWQGVYWTHNDSGDEARIFAIDANGRGIKTEWAEDHDSPFVGITIAGAVNIDWEDIAADDQGNLLIGAFGNNGNTRRDLAIYVVPEPNPREQRTTRVRRRIDFHYPDQTGFPDEADKNFDCEALFYANDQIYLLTKHRSDDFTKLYRLDQTEPFVSNPATYLSRFETGDRVTGADCTPDGQKLAVLTYGSVWVFLKPSDSDDYLAGEAYRYPLSFKQCEAICWDDENTLLITNEQGGMARLAFDDSWPRD